MAASYYTFVGDGTTTTFSTPDITSSDANSYTVTVDGITQIPNSNYSVSLPNKTITFVEAPPVNTNVLVVPR
jgi:hypothetical protein